MTNILDYSNCKKENSFYWCFLQWIVLPHTPNWSPRQDLSFACSLPFRDFLRQPSALRDQCPRKLSSWSVAVSPFFDASGNKNIGATIRIGREILCLPYAVCRITYHQTRELSDFQSDSRALPPLPPRPAILPRTALPPHHWTDQKKRSLRRWNSQFCTWPQPNRYQQCDIRPTSYFAVKSWKETDPFPTPSPSV